MTHVVAQLDRSHSSLVEAAISVPWTMMDEAFAHAYMRFVQALLCSRSEFVQTTLEKIVKGFRFRRSFSRYPPLDFADFQHMQTLQTYFLEKMDRMRLRAGRRTTACTGCSAVYSTLSRPYLPPCGQLSIDISRTSVRIATVKLSTSQTRSKLSNTVRN